MLHEGGPGAAHRARTLVVLGPRRHEDRVRHLLQVSQRDPGIGISVGDDLSLLGELEATLERPRRAREDGPVHGSATTSDGPATSVEEGQTDSVSARDVGESFLGPIQHPGGRERTRLLGRVGIAEHDLLATAAPLEMLPVAGIGQQPVDDRLAVGERVRGLEQGHHVQRPRAARDRRQPEHVEDILLPVGEAHDIPMTGILAERALDLPDGLERAQDLAQWHARRGILGQQLRRHDRRDPAIGRWRSRDAGLAEHLQRPAMDGAVLTHLEAERVEPKGLDLPAKVEQVAVCDPRQALARPVHPAARRAPR